MSTDNRTFGSNQDLDAAAFVDRRGRSGAEASPSKERRQFSDGRENLSPEAAELANAVDQYKMANRRKYVSYEEVLTVIKSLGYSK